MLEKFKQHLFKNHPYLKDKKILIAVSGGLDSMILTHLMHQLNLDIALAHCNFKLRGAESDTDEQFVKNYASINNIPFFTTYFNTTKIAEKNKISIQMAARDLRYEWFNKILNKHQYDFLLTAHHLDDMFETFLINLCRGTGLDGLIGIPQINDKIVRPLLIFSREEIFSFAQKEKIEWREDESNLTLKYHRNKIRHQVVPVLKELNPSLLNSFQNTLNHLKNSQEILLNHINDIKDQIIIKEVLSNDKDIILKIVIEKFNRLSHPKNYLFELLKNYGFTEWDDVANLGNAQSGKTVLSKTHRLIKDRDYLLLTLNPKTKTEDSHSSEYEILPNTKSISTPINLKFESLNPANVNLKSASENYIIVDKDLLKFPLILRKWKKGDYFYPFGMEGSKKLSKFFKDEKYSLPQKENTWLLCSENQIIWVVGKRPDNRFRVTSQTNHILKITIDNEEIS
ncbi:MAG TPA: tRNA lysidine(34) synthetase TilS [Flavobacteriaceae bacterium]|nr:tRNA lysidine(34) synthetase TilS [Flavobacteriaceae bacterium]HEX5743788.1 tRNA lysidine(34) synthetase TilS [Flavobacteriaceae bacterium]